MMDATHKTTYAISDPHGCMEAFKQALCACDLSGDAHLYLLGDYIPHGHADMSGEEYVALCVEALEFVRAFEMVRPHKVTVLPGNHELWLLDSVDYGFLKLDRGLERWLRKLPRFVETERQIFVHAGVDEEAGEYWRWGSEDWFYCSKYPATFGAFEKDIVAGHVGARGLAHDDAFEGVFWDGQSHYFIDGSTEETGRINILIYDAEGGTYSQRIATAAGVSGELPIENCGYLVG